MSVLDMRWRLNQAINLERDGQVLQAEMLYGGILKDWPASFEAATGIARLATGRGDSLRASRVLRDAAKWHPANLELRLDLAVALASSEQYADAIHVLEATVAEAPDLYAGWLLLGKFRDAIGDGGGSLKAWFEAVTKAQRAGVWRDEASTPPHLLELVLEAIERLRLGRRDLFFGAYEDLRRQFGTNELRRVDRALTGYLREWDSTPSDPRQRPKFFFFPDLPNLPYHAPNLQPWAERLTAAYPKIRTEALQVLEEDQLWPDFLQLSDRSRMDQYLTGVGRQPAWEAFFFYRRGERFDANHARCPQTSKVLESIELCRIADQAPEICFSLLKPGSHILPHYGVSNVRMVMHLPLLVPTDCALNLIDAGEHQWKEGRLVMFDDTYKHEAWNRSTATRVVLLMDCWNPHLTEVERLAVKALIETITGLQLAARSLGRAVQLGG